jgi:hypothetical protein
MLRRRALIFLTAAAAVAPGGRVQTADWAKVVDLANKQGWVNILLPGGNL